MFLSSRVVHCERATAERRADIRKALILQQTVPMTFIDQHTVEIDRAREVKRERLQKQTLILVSKLNSVTNKINGNGLCLRTISNSSGESSFLYHQLGLLFQHLHIFLMGLVGIYPFLSPHQRPFEEQ